ncbi:hypothetical protein BT96DRAFT_261797 [Gymnopus androsaceus JB14]|uniref:Uncharacterized protein n=1 Tax=Gymnopus androsaceus JB14 TaxID=1447944 RepID=A0A6A4H5W9_9AGAR|nr:hypothetical protein BT96DRAFT_261797 [Gymnopus androsaceus JB14]
MRKLDTAEGDAEEEILQEKKLRKKWSQEETQRLYSAWSRKLEDYTKRSYNNRYPLYERPLPTLWTRTNNTTLTLAPTSPLKSVLLFPTEPSCSRKHGPKSAVRSLKKRTVH